MLIVGFVTQVSVDNTTPINTITDCLQFVTEFFEIISQSGPHIYHSALQLAPQSSIVQRLYSQQVYSPVVRVVTGVPTSWDLCTAIAGTPDGVPHAVWSPCGQYIASACINTIQVRDSNTLERVSVLETPDLLSDKSTHLTFSPNGCLLACICPGHTRFVNCHLYAPSLTTVSRDQAQSHAWQIIIWDVQTGILANTIESQTFGKLVFSRNHRIITLLGEDSICHTYDVLNGIELCQGNIVSSPCYGASWVHEDTLQFATGFRTDEVFVINIYQLQPTPTNSLHIISSFHVPQYYGYFSFSPASSHAAFTAKTEVVILDVQTSKLLLQTKVNPVHYQLQGKFSPDGCFFACEVSVHEICVWQNTSTNYVPWCTLQPRLPFNQFSFSPITSSILTWGFEGIQLLYSDKNLSTPDPNRTRPNHQGRGHLVAYSKNCAHIATAQEGDSIVTVLDPVSGVLLQSIDTGVEIEGVGIIDDRILVVSEGALSWWNLEVGESVLSANCLRIEWITVTGSHRIHLAFSPNGSWIAFASGGDVFLYDINTLKILAKHTPDGVVSDIQFTPHQNKLQLLVYVMQDQYSPLSICKTSVTAHNVELEIAEDGGFGNVTTELLEGWWSWVNLFSCGYYIESDDGQWVVDPIGTKLFWLPPDWRIKDCARWSGNFLILANPLHPKPIIIQFHPDP